jgi:hypothetical protein
VADAVVPRSGLVAAVGVAEGPAGFGSAVHADSNGKTAAARARWLFIVRVLM